MLGPEINFIDRDYLLFEDKKLLYLAGIDYHRMSNNPMIIQSMSDAARSAYLSQYTREIYCENMECALVKALESEGGPS